MAGYIEDTLENIKKKEICGGCRYLTSYLDCHINKEDYRDYEKTICKFYEKRILWEIPCRARRHLEPKHGYAL